MNGKLLKNLFFCVFILVVLVCHSTAAELIYDTEWNYVKYINGYQDGTVRPDAVLTRAQAAQMLSMVCVSKQAEEHNFFDVPDGHWASEAVNALAADDVILGFADGSFRPDGSVTRAQFAAMLHRIYIPETEQRQFFSDIAGHWAEEEISAYASAGYLRGYPDGSFRPERAITRAEAVTVLNRVLKNQSTRTEDLFFFDLPKEHWAYHEIQAAASPFVLKSSASQASVRFSEIEAMPIRVEQIKPRVDALLAEFVEVPAVRQKEIYDEIGAISVKMQTAMTLAQINRSRDAVNEQYRTDSINLPAFSRYHTELLNQRYTAVMASGHAEELAELMGLASLSELEPPQPIMPSELVALHTEEAEIVSEYLAYYNTNVITYEGKNYSLSQALNAPSDVVREMACEYAVETYEIPGKLFDRLVKVRTKIAQYYGYENYAEVGYLISGKDAYGAEEAAVLRERIKKQIVPLYRKLRLSGIGQGVDVSVSLDAMQDTMQKLSPQSRQTLRCLTECEMHDLLPRENKASGAFSIYLQEFDTPFLFVNFSDDFEGWSTFVHEFGHCVQFFRAYPNGVSSIPSDLSEVASYGMEHLLTASYSHFFEECADLIEQYLLVRDLSLMIASTFLDEFQARVYQNPDMGIKARNYLYTTLREEYYGKSEYVHKAYEDGILWTNYTHVAQTPFYAIDYTLAMSAALQIWQAANDDFDQAFEMYLGLIESPYASYGIDAVCRINGLKSPFSQDALDVVVELICDKFSIDTGGRSNE